MQDVRFRKARAQDVPAIVALLTDDVLGSQREDGALPDDACYVAAFAAIESDPNQILAVAEESGRVVGTLQLTFIPGLSKRGAWRAQIKEVRIMSGRRGSGLGRRMLEWAIEMCRARGCAYVQLTTDKRRQDAHRFYEKLGFAPSHLGYRLSL